MVSLTTVRVRAAPPNNNKEGNKKDIFIPTTTSTALVSIQSAGVSKRKQISIRGTILGPFRYSFTFIFIALCAFAFYHHAINNNLLPPKDSHGRRVIPPGPILHVSSHNQSSSSSTIPRPYVAPPAEQKKHALYRPEQDPIYSRVPPHKVRIRVLLMTKGTSRIYFRNHSDPTALMSDEVLNICLDGWNRSPYFDVLDSAWTVVPDHRLAPEFRLKEADDVVWVVDMRRFRRANRKETKDYTILDELVILANNTLRYQYDFATLTGRQVPKLRIVLMDFRDNIVEDAHCSDPVKNLIAMLGPANVRIVMQQTVRNRHWDVQRGFVQIGTVYNAEHDNACLGHNILQMPYTVRSDIADAVNRTFSQFLPRGRTMSLGEHRTPVDTIRPVDVAHFWEFQHSNIPAPGVRRSPMPCHLRNMATLVVNKLSPPYKTLAKVVSPKDRTSVADAYVEALLSCKIVVVAQRDSWEDHYRLFEAFAGGALVFTDPMLTLPMGLVDRQSIIVYQSQEDLTSLLLYYLHHEAERLAIAKRGWEIAMTQHQTHHWMERLFFGKVFTT